MPYQTNKQKNILMHLCIQSIVKVMHMLTKTSLGGISERQKWIFKTHR